MTGAVVPCSREAYEARMFAASAALFSHHVADIEANHARLTSPSVPDILSCTIVGMGGHTVVVAGDLESVGFRLPPGAETARGDRGGPRCPLDCFIYPPTEMRRYVDAARRFFDMTPADEERCESFLEERRSDVAAYDIGAVLARLDAQALAANPGLAPGDAGADALLALLAELGEPAPTKPHERVRQFRREFPMLAVLNSSRIWAHDMGRVARRRLIEGRDVTDVLPTLTDAFRAAGIGGVLPTIGRVASRRVINGAAMLHRLHAVASPATAATGG